MASDRKQINIRLAPDSETRLHGLVERMTQALGFEVSQADVIRAALIELEKKYPPEQKKRRAK